MPPLRLTRQQIVERATRDIRLRTEVRLAQLRPVVLETKEDFEDEEPPSCEVGLRRQTCWSVCVQLICFLLRLLLLLLLSLIILYHATKKTESTL